MEFSLFAPLKDLLLVVAYLVVAFLPLVVAFLVPIAAALPSERRVTVYA